MQEQSLNFGFTPGDVIVVTGAGSGIGRAIAVRAAQQGLRVAAWDLAPDGLAQTVAQIEAEGGEALPVVADVADQEAVVAAMEVSRSAGTVRHLVNNAGPASGGPTLEFDEAVRIALGSVRRVTETWLAEAPAGATLVNMASVAGNIVGTSPDWYPASKAGIAGYTRHLAAYRADVVRANAVAPGMVDTPRLQGFSESETGQSVLRRIPLHRMAQPDDIAYVTLFLLSPAAAYVNGVLVPVDGGWTITQ
ncbi:NAD(P)-dependent dehydrogenase (short-subunit alcohol dehydrogenase family) [Branchiibius hedensis]|uniref:NAD(P)-dependent dehydrogenase, short-chain alcohol dehydrogenase family n=1 Tax=Branchiibius hedensis TaxID=672460 RepID=A0A2Y8ZTX2_9MICO|nr:SDR family oxidoreductase [Branchiibius hedensis]PWJ27050.1 NAD(P)-dependent dehydrogenase (short-subunit alcohol dehydrogenase family) [Branchiibius hedensis]SSA35861.1 NAD(P)-dependent dehydrogenase, short-chain alcohol dehydrogenase family [Branchiibius hedensis]